MSILRELWHKINRWNQSALNKEKMTQEITACNGCNCMTKSIRKARAVFICGKCGHDKTLGDVFQYEMKHTKQWQIEKKLNSARIV